MQMQRTKQGMQTVRWLVARTAGSRRCLGGLIALQMAVGASGIGYALLLRQAIDAAVSHAHKGFWMALLWFGVLVLGRIALRGVQRVLEEHTRATLENRLKSRFFSYVLDRSYPAVSAVHTGEWMQRLTSDTVITADGLTQILPGLSGMLVKLIGAMVVLCWMMPFFGWLILPLGLLFTVLTWFFRVKLKKLHLRIQEADSQLRITLQECLSSLMLVRVFVRGSQTESAIETGMAAHKAARMTRNRYYNWWNMAFEGIVEGAYLTGLLLCGYGILMDTMSYGTLLAVLQLVRQVQSPFANLTGFLPRSFAMLASAERLIAIEQLAADAVEHPLSDAEIAAEYAAHLQAIGLRDASFAYQPRTETESAQPVVLKDLQLMVRKGAYVALTGPSGCGKSTIFKLLMCLYPMDSGTRYLQTTQGEQPLTADWRGLFAYVPQEHLLMRGTIREIVTFSADQTPADDAKVWEALEIACADAFLRAMPDGLDTRLGERGMGLSQGQMQRIAVARAVYSARPILLLDECTSALDAATEERLLLHLRAMTNRTVLIVTHRPAALRICDAVLTLTNDGPPTFVQQTAADASAKKRCD